MAGMTETVDYVELGETLPKAADVAGEIVEPHPLNLYWQALRGLLIQAASGQGKSWLIRRLVELLFGKIQIFIVDPEGEFGTLREKFDFVLVSSDGGDTATDVRSAEALTLKLVELGASAIFDVSELPVGVGSKQEYVKILCETLINIPRELRHPILFICDEVHLFAPQRDTGDSEITSTNAIIDLCARGRKRGIIPVFATQRMAKVHKDAIAELPNYLIGGTMLDSDVRRAIEHLGIEGKNKDAFSRTIRLLNAGEFYALGRSMTRVPELFRVGPVITSHPKVGVYTPPIKTPKNIQKLLPDLSSLPQAHDLDNKTPAELRFDLEKALLRIDELEAGGSNGDEVGLTEQEMWERLEPRITAAYQTQLRSAVMPLYEYTRRARGVVSALAALEPAITELRKLVQVLPSTTIPKIVMPRLESDVLSTESKTVTKRGK